MPQATSLTELVKRSFFEMMKDVCTSIVGHVIAFDPETQLAQVQIGIQRVDVNGKFFVPPPLLEVPVYFAGGDFMIEHEVKPNTEGVILFSQRCIDAWLNEGGVAPNPILRFHDYSDAIFFCGLRSQPKAIKNFANDGIRLRNKNGDAYIWLKSNGNIYIKGDVFVEGDVVADGISLKSHTHPYTDDGTPKNTGAPNP
jgi:hypothetical protein